MKNLTTETFKEKIVDFESKTEKKLKNKLPCIIDFYADWCAPCRILSPTLETLAEEYKGKINVFKVNTDEEQELSDHYNISSIPTMIFFPKNGDPVFKRGAISKKNLKQMIEEILLGNGD